MNVRLALRPEAVDDLREAFWWYEGQSPGTGHSFLLRFKVCLERILENPTTYPMVLQSIRRAPLKRFPYGVYYEVQDDRVVVLAVFHFKRAPDGWAGRVSPRN